MQENLGNLLEELDSAYPECKLTTNELMEKGIPSDLILDGFARDLIRDANSPLVAKIVGIDNRAIPCIITIKGFEYLNQIRIKKTIEKLDTSINKFNESNDESSNKIDVSINKFNNSSEISSKILVELTQAIYTFTLILVAIPLIDKILGLKGLEGPIYWIIGYIVIVIVVVAVMLICFEFYKKQSG